MVVSDVEASPVLGYGPGGLGAVVGNPGVTTMSVTVAGDPVLPSSRL
jgi:hypothetical protein